MNLYRLHILSVHSLLFNIQVYCSACWDKRWHKAGLGLQLQEGTEHHSQLQPLGGQTQQGSAQARGVLNPRSGARCRNLLPTHAEPKKGDVLPELPLLCHRTRAHQLTLCAMNGTPRPGKEGMQSEISPAVSWKASLGWPRLHAVPYVWQTQMAFHSLSTEKRAGSQTADFPHWPTSLQENH